MSILHPRLTQLINKAKKTDAYWVERAKTAFAISLDKRCRSAGLNNTQLADKLETSPAYITKVFRGDTNFTIETMVKLARATGGKLEINIVEEAVQFQPAIAAPGKLQASHAATSTVVQVVSNSANHAWWNEMAAAA